MATYKSGVFRINFFSRHSDDITKTFYFHYDEHTIVGDAIKICEQATGIDMQEYMLSAEYPVGPRCSNPVFSNNFEAYSAMPPSDRETNFVRVIREAQETAAQHYGNTELASILRRQSRMRLIRINISHRDASS